MSDDLVFLSIWAFRLCVWLENRPPLVLIHVEKKLGATGIVQYISSSLAPTSFQRQAHSYLYIYRYLLCVYLCVSYEVSTVVGNQGQLPIKCKKRLRPRPAKSTTRLCDRMRCMADQSLRSTRLLVFAVQLSNHSLYNVSPRRYISMSFGYIEYMTIELHFSEYIIFQDEPTQRTENERSKNMYGA